jgi:tetratricopeptide (TPR) repeat protein
LIGSQVYCLSSRTRILPEWRYEMHRSFLLLALLSLAVTGSTNAQAPVPQSTPEALTAAYNQAIQAKDWPGAVTAARQLVEISASSQNLRLLATAQLDDGSVRHDSGAIQESLATYDRALAAAEQEKPAQGQPDADWKDNLSKIYTGKGNALLKLQHNAEAVEAYNHAAEFAANPGLAYFNVCATLYNIGDTHGSAAACRKSVQADPSRANAWFVLGSDLFADSTVGANGKVGVSDEARQALEKYLELAPDGPHAADVKAMLDMAAK